LFQGEDLAVGDRRAVVGGVGIVGDVLVVTALAGEVFTNARGEIALTARV
jgi:hypothetical protein